MLPLAISLALKADRAEGQVYNITNGEPTPFKELIEEALQDLGLPIRYKKLPAFLLGGLASTLEILYRVLPLKGEPPLTRYTYYLLRYSQTLDISKAREELGYEPRLSIKEGIARYVPRLSKALSTSLLAIVLAIWPCSLRDRKGRKWSFQPASISSNTENMVYSLRYWLSL